MAISGLRIIRYHKWRTSLMTLCNTPRSVPKAGRSNTLFPNKYQYVQLDISISMTFTYDHIQMVYTWIPTYCKDPSNSCSRRVTNFNLHGLWPANAKGYVLRPCQTTPPNLTDVYKALRPDLGNYWPSLTTRWTNEKFWDHEWTDHGSCVDEESPNKVTQSP
ncbi:hypothetical protein LguiB_013486 [Lonicera macranthoides]